MDVLLIGSESHAAANSDDPGAYSPHLTQTLRATRPCPRCALADPWLLTVKDACKRSERLRSGASLNHEHFTLAERQILNWHPVMSRHALS